MPPSGLPQVDASIATGLAAVVIATLPDAVAASGPKSATHRMSDAPATLISSPDATRATFVPSMRIWIPNAGTKGGPAPYREPLVARTATGAAHSFLDHTRPLDAGRC